MRDVWWLGSSPLCMNERYKGTNAQQPTSNAQWGENYGPCECSVTAGRLAFEESELDYEPSALPTNLSFAHRP